MEKEQLELLLISSGLTKKETKIYLFLLEKGPNKALKIFRSLKMKKGNTYALLEKLIKKGFVFKKRTLFYPESPLKIFQRLEEKTKAVETSLTNFKTLLPQLSSMYKLSVGKPTIRYFEGEGGLKEVFEDVYAPGKEVIYGCVDISLPSREMFDHIVENLIPRRIKNKIVSRAFDVRSPQSEELQKRDKEELREIFLVDGEKYPMPAEIDVYQDKIAMLSFVKNDFIGVLIENQAFAETLKSIFKIALDLATKEKKSKGKNKIVG